MTSKLQRQNSNRSSCTQCGSSNWQSVELAHSQSTRISESGYQTVSKFCQSLAPPEQRSIFGAPLFSAAGLSSGTLVFLPVLLTEQHGSLHAAESMFDSQIYGPAFLVAVIAFLIHLMVNVRYNISLWPAKYAKWQGCRVCRRCGHRSIASYDCGGRSSGSLK